MHKLFLYLLESGLCLSLMFLLYLVLFRKETYFSFIRYYLVGIIFFGLVIPVIHVNISMTQPQTIEPTFKEIGRIRNYYERMIALSDPETGTYYENGIPRAVFEEQWANDQKRISNSGIPSHLLGIPISNDAQMPQYWSLLQRILVLYLVGVFFFFFRFLYFLIRLLWLISKNKVIDKFGVKIVLLPDEIPPYSFFRYVFINEKVVDLPECRQIIAHESVHIRQKHSIDLIIAQALVIFQWFNPLVWHVQKAIKTNHEFIADSKVVENGFELFDYQTLLLSQLISIRSVELVNNLNLISIKKRIAMMTKIKSGLRARMKILITIPSAFLLLFLFSNLTISSPEVRFGNFSPISMKIDKSDLNGMWMSGKDLLAYSLINIGPNSIQILGDENTIQTYKMEIMGDYFLVNSPLNEGLKVPFQVSANVLKVWWKSDKPVIYDRSSYTNSLEVLLGQVPDPVILPFISYTRILDPDRCIPVIIDNERVVVNDEKGPLTDFEKLIVREKEEFPVLERSMLTIKLLIDKETSMKRVSTVYEALRRNGLLKIAYSGIPSDPEVPTLLYHTVGIPKLLPPLGAEFFTAEETEEMVSKEYLDIMMIDDKTQTPEQAKLKLIEMLRNHPEKVVVLLKYTNNTIYSNYLSYIDMLYDAYQELRDEKSMAQYQLPFNDLGAIQQKKIRKIYPMRISEWNLDADN